MRDHPPLDDGADDEPVIPEIVQIVGDALMTLPAPQRLALIIETVARSTDTGTCVLQLKRLSTVATLAAQGAERDAFLKRNRK